MTFDNGAKIMVGGKVLDVLCAELTCDDEFMDTRDDCFSGRHRFDEPWKMEVQFHPEALPFVPNCLLNNTQGEIEAYMMAHPGKMPRKMKKACQSKCRRDTKWERKAERHINRIKYHARHAIMTCKENGETLTVEMKFKMIETNFPVSQNGHGSIRISGNSFRDILVKKHQSKGQTMSEK